MLISPAYKELQRDLHATQDYGIGMHAKECAMLVSELGVESEIETVLDYGSGAKSHLANLLPQLQVSEYDPAVPGKDAEPKSADVVVCSDVLEHIEPDCLGDVLQDIRRLAKRSVVLVIATAPAKKVMADGRNAHLIVENPSWWAAQLGSFFNIEKMLARNGSVTVIARPKPFQIGQIKVTAAVEHTERNENVRKNCATISKRLPTRIAPHDRRAVVVCAGPSLIDTWPSIAMAQVSGADVYSTSIAHNFLLERNIVPVAHLDCDPREHKWKQLSAPDKRVQYWLASCVHPGYLDKLAGYDVSLWHSYNGTASEPVVAKCDPGREIIIGGGSIGLRALSVLYCQGYRSFEIHGMDCSYRDDGVPYCGTHLGKKLDTIPIICGGRAFTSTVVHIAYARYFFKSQKMLNDATFHIHGNGLLAEMVKQGMLPGAVEDTTDDE